MKTKLNIGLAAIGIALSGTVMAQPAEMATPWHGDFWGYVGASAGESKFRNDCHRTDVFACDHRDTAWKVYAGGNMNRIFGLEVGYTDFGQIQASGGDTKAWAANVSLTAGVPLGDRFNIFAKGGGIYGHTDVTEDPTTLFDTGHKSGWGTTYGVGASYAVTRNLLVRADWDSYNLDFIGGSRDVDLASAGLAWRF